MSAWDLVSTLAAQVHDPLDVELPSGFKVHFEQGFYWIRFPFERTVVQCMRTIPGAQYIPTERLWCVPLVQYEALASTIDQIREHYRALEISQEQVQQWCTAHHPERQVRKAYTKDGAAHMGVCLMVNAHYCVFSEGTQTLRVHERAALTDEHDTPTFTPQEHTRYRIEYRAGTGRCFPSQESSHA